MLYSYIETMIRISSTTTNNNSSNGRKWQLIIKLKKKTYLVEILSKRVRNKYNLLKFSICSRVKTWANNTGMEANLPLLVDRKDSKTSSIRVRESQTSTRAWRGIGGVKNTRKWGLNWILQNDFFSNSRTPLKY